MACLAARLSLQLWVWRLLSLFVTNGGKFRRFHSFGQRIGHFLNATPDDSDRQGLRIKLIDGQSDLRLIGTFSIGQEGDLDGESLLGRDNSLQGRDDDLLALLLVVELKLKIEWNRVLDGVVLSEGCGT